MTVKHWDVTKTGNGEQGTRKGGWENEKWEQNRDFKTVTERARVEVRFCSHFSFSPSSCSFLVLENKLKLPKSRHTHTKKNTSQNSPTPQKSRNRKFQTSKNHSIILVTWNPEYPPPPHPWVLHAQSCCSSFYFFDPLFAFLLINTWQRLPLFLLLWLFRFMLPEELNVTMKKLICFVSWKKFNGTNRK